MPGFLMSLPIGAQLGVMRASSGSSLASSRSVSSDATEVVLEDSFHVATLDNDAPTIFARSVAWIRERTPAAEPR